MTPCASLAAVWLVAYGPLIASADQVAPQTQESLRPLLTITWKRATNLPQGFQDSDGGILDHTLITVGGFCGGQRGVPGKETVYPRGFLNKVWSLDLQRPHAIWQRAPDFPGAARQELFAITAGEGLWCWGGLSYTAPYCYEDGYRLAKKAGVWQWDALPPLPWPASSSGIAAIGSKIYVFGGADYDTQKFYTAGDRKGGTQRLGARLLSLDTRDLPSGWRRLPDCPGTPRWVCAMAALGGQIYILGGASGNDNPTGNYATVVDNWRFDAAAETWHRLRDLPVASGNFPSGRIVYDDRYLLLVGGYQYESVLDPDGTARPPYGTPTKHYPNKPYCSDVFVYDTLSGAFGTATPLPLNNNLPMTVVDGDSIHLIGGETAGCEIEGEPFGHHPDLYLLGTIRKAAELPATPAATRGRAD